jgi:hypothetical protein
LGGVLFIAAFSLLVAEMTWDDGRRGSTKKGLQLVLHEHPLLFINDGLEAESRRRLTMAGCG